MTQLCLFPFFLRFPWLCAHEPPFCLLKSLTVTALLLTRRPSQSGVLFSFWPCWHIPVVNFGVAFCFTDEAFPLPTFPTRTPTRNRRHLCGVSVGLCFFSYSPPQSLLYPILRCFFADSKNRFFSDSASFSAFPPASPTRFPKIFSPPLFASKQGVSKDQKKLSHAFPQCCFSLFLSPPRSWAGCIDPSTQTSHVAWERS